MNHNRIQQYQHLCERDHLHSVQDHQERFTLSDILPVYYDNCLRSGGEKHQLGRVAIAIELKYHPLIPSVPHNPDNHHVKQLIEPILCINNSDSLKVLISLSMPPLINSGITNDGVVPNGGHIIRQGITIVDAQNGFNELFHMMIIWIVRH